MCFKAIGAFGGAPGFSEKPIHVSPEHGRGVIQVKKWIEVNFLKLPLTADTPARPFDGEMLPDLEGCFDPGRVIWVLVTGQDRSFSNDGSDFLE